MKSFLVSIFCLLATLSYAQSWSKVGEGIEFNPDEPRAVEIFSFDNKLFAGGYITKAGNNPATGIAYWDNSRWLNFTTDITDFKSITSFVVYKNELYGFATYFNPLILAGLVKFDVNEQVWKKVPNSKIIRYANNGNSYSGYIQKAVEFQGELYIMGRFDKIGDNSTSTSLAKWNGEQWTPVLDDNGNNIYIGWPTDMEVFQNSLLISARRTHLNNDSFVGVVRFDGTSWSSLDINPSGGGNLPFIEQLEVFNGALYAAGRGAIIPNDDKWYWMVKWDGQSWHGIELFEQSPLQDDNSISALKAYGNYLAIGSTSMGNTSFYNGETLRYLDRRLNGPISFFEIHNTQLYASGYFRGPSGEGISKLNKLSDNTPSSTAFSIFPNPSNGNFVLEYVIEENTRVIIELFDSSGKIVLKKIFNDLEGEYARYFDIKDFSAGTYVLKMQTKGFTKTELLIKN